MLIPTDDTPLALAQCDSVSLAHKILIFLYVKQPWNLLWGSRRFAQYRLTRIDAHHVQYRVKDTKNRRLTPVIYSNEEFVRLLMPHVNDRYCNSMRYFGLLAPRSKMLLPKVFSVLKQQQRPRPVRLRYAESIYRTFGQNPLIGLDGQPLLRVGHINPLPLA